MWLTACPVYQPLETYRVGRNEIVAGTVSPSYLLPIHGLQRLEKIMDEYVGGISTTYMTNGLMLERGLELLKMLKEDVASIGAEDLHQLQRAWELNQRSAFPRGRACAGLALLHALAVRRDERPRGSAPSTGSRRSHGPRRARH